MIYTQDGNSVMFHTCLDEWFGPVKSGRYEAGILFKSTFYDYNSFQNGRFHYWFTQGYINFIYYKKLWFHSIKYEYDATYKVQEMEKGVFEIALFRNGRLQIPMG